MTGGQNKTHGSTGSTARLDSFSFARATNALQPGQGFTTTISWTYGNRYSGTESSVSIRGNRTRIKIKAQATDNSGETYAIAQDVLFSTVQNNYGGSPRLYFTCPYCFGRARYIYLTDRHGRQQPFACVKCSNLNYTVTQQTKGEWLYVHKIEELLRTKYKVPYKDIKAPFDMIDYCFLPPPKPRYMRWANYEVLNRELRRLVYIQQSYMIKAANRILGRAINVMGG
jgi:hypothetical protein